MVKLTKTTKIVLLITFVIVLLGIFWFILGVGLRYTMGDTSESRSLWRQRSRDIVGSVKSGFSREQVIKIAKEHGFTDSQINSNNSELLLWTPSEWLASNWVITFGFSDDKLIYVRVRTAASPKHKPHDATEDIIYSQTMSK
jgi:hypothetical protein